MSVGGANRDTGIRKPAIGSDVAQPGFSGLVYGETETQRRPDREVGHFPTGQMGKLRPRRRRVEMGTVALPLGQVRKLRPREH